MYWSGLRKILALGVPITLWRTGEARRSEPAIQYAPVSRKGFACWSLVVALVLLIVGAGLALSGPVRLGLGSGSAPQTDSAQPALVPPPTATEPILPPPPTQTIQPEATVSSLTRSSAMPPPPEDGLYSQRERLGLCGGQYLDQDLAGRLGAGWYLDWRASPEAVRSAAVRLEAVEYVPMIRLKGGQPSPSGEHLLAAVDAMPGALWLIGNEPDVEWQDNIPPELYAQLYHDLYALLKERDPTCQVAIGGVSQPTPLRLRYLDRILQEHRNRYGEPMPVDFWNVHNFVLREQRDSWGVGIPPGLADDSGRLREISDHADLGIFRQQIVDFRRWMAERGQRDKPLLITEYGILMPADYGFPPDKVEGFMLDTFEFLRTATDPALGYPADGDRLVQRWCWYSLWDLRYPTGNLLQPGGEELTPLGEVFGEYAHSLP